MLRVAMFSAATVVIVILAVCRSDEVGGDDRKLQVKLGVGVEDDKKMLPGFKSRGKLVKFDSPDAVPGNYIFKWTPDANQTAVSDILGRIRLITSFQPQFAVGHVWEGFGFSVRNAVVEVADMIAAMEMIEYGEVDEIVRTTQEDQQPGPGACTVQEPAEDGLDRLDQSENTLSCTYTYDNTSGDGTNIYIIDTGIRTFLHEFGGRAVFGATFCRNPCVRFGDGVGHGTHVAGIACSDTYGVAKRANCIAVQVLDSTGSGLKSDIISGVEFVRQDYVRRGRPRSVINMSLGGPASPAEDDMIAKARDDGIIIVTSAGNSNIDACNQSPARIRRAITVACSVPFNNEPCDFTNLGQCVDIFAPGFGIRSTFPPRFPTFIPARSLSGTSQSSPHVAGVVARYWSLNPGLTAGDVERWLLDESPLIGKIRPGFGNRRIRSLRGTPNKSLYMTCPLT